MKRITADLNHITKLTIALLEPIDDSLPLVVSDKGARLDK